MTPHIGKEIFRHDIETIILHGAHLNELSATSGQTADFTDITNSEWAIPTLTVASRFSGIV